MVRPVTGMKRTAFYLSKTQIDKLKKMAQKAGLSASEILRRAIDEYFDKNKK
jgi:hypothetical protein